MITVWDLARSDQTVEGLREYLRDYAVEAFSELEGMRFKVWFANPENQTWGAVYLWESAEALTRNTPPKPSKAIELIGYPPTSVSVFEVEAATAPGDEWQALAGIGNAMR
ncbi:YdhR family protein [Lipingzhangella halophila]|nr:YdhR family protein [Lipingzhangella halophila]